MNDSELHSLTLGLPPVDDYLQFVGVRCRPNTWLATAYDLLVFFSVIPKYPAAVTTTDVFRFLEVQRSSRGDGRVVRLEDRERGLAVRTVKRRLASVSGLFAYLVARGDAGVKRTLSRAGWLRGEPDLGWGSAGYHYFALHARCRGSSRLRRPTRLWLRSAPTATGRWSRPCFLAVSAAARSWACGYTTSFQASAASLSPRAKAAISVWSPSRHASSPALAAYLTEERPST